MMRRVIVESPYKGIVSLNVEYAREACRDCLRRGEAPYASHLFFTQFLNDDIPEDRDLGIQAGLEWGAAAQAVMVYADLGITDGMAIGIARHMARNTPVFYRSLSKQNCFHSVQNGETLGEIAFEFFGTPDRWREIAFTNRLTLARARKERNVEERETLIFPGTMLLIEVLPYFR